MDDEVIELDEAQEYLEGLVETKSNPKTEIITQKDTIPQPYKDFSDYEDFDGYMLGKNQEIIEMADDFLIERLRNQDFSIKTSDLVNIRETAFKQMRAIRGMDDGENRNLIPATINIQVINNF